MQHATLLALALAIALPACATAAADPDKAPKAPPPAEACKPGGKVVFEIDHRVEPGVAQPTSTLKLFAGGAWTRDATGADGKPQPPTTGCVAAPDYKQLADAIHAAPWKISNARVHCMAMSPQFTEFRVDGKVVFTQKLCSGQSLDDKSRAALDRAIAQLEPPAAPPAPAQQPPPAKAP
ncbi:MAG TPA: hypothetical protein VK601_27835 [Kofleriaceae bacterium]|nr:hypothetical protein [Kofleriaceae bacterium]